MDGLGGGNCGEHSSLREYVSWGGRESRFDRKKFRACRSKNKKERVLRTSIIQYNRQYG